MTMARVLGNENTIELMINCKTCPAVSSKYVETVCTGGVTAEGKFVRLYPVAFRFSDPNGLQVLKCRVSVRRHFCHPTSFQGRGCENGRSTEDPASES